MNSSPYDIAVVGGGIVGMSFAMQAAEAFPRASIVVLEKEDGLARHQTGHNSGVIHSGVYYKPGSLKAKLCVAGAREMVEFCAGHGVPYEVCGKLIVVIPERDPEKHDRQRGYPLGPGNTADGYVHIDFLCLRFIQLVGRA